MKVPIWILTVFMPVCLSTGCIIIGKHRGCWCGEGVEVVYHSAESHVCAEIDAIGKLSRESDKQNMYNAIAAREGLSGAEQRHLVRAVYRNLHQESAKEQVLLTLIANPGFTCPAKEAILANLGKLHQESSKRALLEAINKRGSCGDETTEVDVDVDVEVLP